MSVLGFYHNGEALTYAKNVSSLNTEGMYFYNASTGKLTYTTADFSVFSAVVNYGGGNGTKDNSYLVSTGDQAYGARDLKGYFKLVADVVVTKEIYLSAETVVWDLNGRSIQLGYAQDFKPNNGGSFKNYNPGVTEVDPVNEKTGTIALGSGYKTIESTDGEGNTWYNVVKDEA